jgi:hypothetical protein
MALLPVRPPPSTSLVTAALLSREWVDLLERLRDGAIAVVIALVAQLLIAAIQLGLDQEKSEFPAPILAMAAVFLFFTICGCVAPGLEELYNKRLRRAVSTNA